MWKQNSEHVIRHISVIYTSLQCTPSEMGWLSLLFEIIQ